VKITYLKKTVLDNHWVATLCFRWNGTNSKVQNVLLTMLASAVHGKQWCNSYLNCVRFSKVQQLFRLTFVFLFSSAPATLTIITEPTDATCCRLTVYRYMGNVKLTSFLALSLLHLLWTDASYASSNSYCLARAGPMYECLWQGFPL
jgi:hypothetical protein